MAPLGRLVPLEPLAHSGMLALVGRPPLLAGRLGRAAVAKQPALGQLVAKQPLGPLAGTSPELGPLVGMAAVPLRACM